MINETLSIDTDSLKFNEDLSGESPLKIGYFADGKWAHEAFRKIINDRCFSIRFICVRYDARDKTLLELSEKHNIDCLSHEDINSEEFIGLVGGYNCDLFVSMSFNQIFKREIINLPRFRIINCHAGKLPYYRGRNILNWALINDEKEFGITVHYVDEGIDTGDIIIQECYSITDDDDYSSLLERAYVSCAEILYQALTLFRKDIPVGRRQIETHPVGFYCSARKVGDETLNWNQTSREVFNFVRAICKPGPMARTFLNGCEMKINKVEEVKSAPAYKGTVGVILSKDAQGFFVKTKDSFVKVTEFEFDYGVRVGDRFESK